MIAFDSSETGGSLAASPKTWSHTCTGSDLILFVVASTNGGTVSGVTYDGVAMTLLETRNDGDYNLTLWYMLNPPTGSHTISAALSAGSTLTGASASYTGVGAIDAHLNRAGSSGQSSPDVATITTIADNCWVIATENGISATVAVASTGVTERQSLSGGTILGDSNGPVSPAGAYDMEFTFSDFPVAGRSGYSVMASFSPSDGGPPPATQQDAIMMGHAL